MDLRERMIDKVKHRLKEMALSAGDGKDLTGMHSTLYREMLYHEGKNFPKVGDLHVSRTKNGVAYYKMKDDQCVYHSKIKLRNAGNKKLSFAHEEQTHVEKHPDEKNAWVHTYNHFKSSERPLLVSSDIQSDQGKALWRKMSDQALRDGHHVLYHDEYGNLSTITEGNIDHYFSEYHGDEPHHEHRGIILSHRGDLDGR